MQWKSGSCSASLAMRTSPQVEKVRGQEAGQEGQGSVHCPFCRGTGLLPDTRGDCQVCRGYGKFLIELPILKCVFCRGRGRLYLATTMTCLVCKGRGVFTVPESYTPCELCHGSGREGRTIYTCRRCGGKGIRPGEPGESDEIDSRSAKS